MQQESVFLKLILAQMALDGMSVSKIRFLQSVFHVAYRGEVTSRKMAEVAIVTQQSARLMAKELVRARYFKRCSHRTWALADQPIRDSELISLMGRVGLRVSAAA